MVKTPKRGGATQAHVRMDMTKIVVYSMQESRGVLLRGKLKPQSNVQYDSRLKTLQRYLAAARPSKDDDLLRTSKEEFFSFLRNWKEQKRGPARPTLSAFKQFHEMHGLSKDTSFLWHNDTKNAVEGAGKDHVKRDKGVMSEGQHDQLQDVLANGPEEALGSCTWCPIHPDPHLRRRLQLAEAFMEEVPIRLGDLAHVMLKHFVDGTPRSVFCPKLKTADHGGSVIVTEAGWDIMEDGSSAATNGYLFPHCAAQHLGAAVAFCTTQFGWDEGLVWSPYCVRHTGMNRKVAGVKAAVEELLSGVTARTFKTYARPNKERKRAL